MFGVEKQHAHLQGNLVLMLKKGDNSANGGFPEIIGGGVTCQLISSTVVDENNGRGMVGAEASLDYPEQQRLLVPSETHQFGVAFSDWDVTVHGCPGAIIIKNKGDKPFYLKSITVDDVPGCGTIVFLANSWVYPQSKYNYDRVFFANHTYLPSQMPAPLRPYRDDELRNLRGDADEHDAPYEEHHRVYRYDVYNDLGNPDGGAHLARPTLGGSEDHPYPRRGRTGRKPMVSDPSCESLVEGNFLFGNVVYVPCDERFGDFKWDEFRIKNILSLVHRLLPTLTHIPNGLEFDSLQDIINSLYPRGPRKAEVPVNPAVEELRKQLDALPQVKTDDGADLPPINPTPRDHFGWLRYPMPQIIQEDDKAWMSDEEFAREMLAGVNPNVIRRLTEFPPKSTLDPSKFGDQTSTITAAHIQSYLEGLTVQQALESNRLYILDHHDHYMPFLVDVNKLDGNFIYASRTLLFLRGDGTLTPVAIELSLPEVRDDGITAAKSTVYTPKPVPATNTTADVDAWVWQLAKAYVNVDDYCWHQGVSHWLHTHAVMEPFVIATNRQLSVTHPVHKLLLPHFRDTMKINALARQNLVNAEGIFEDTVFAGKYAFEITSKVYGSSWNFTEQALPNDLIKRGMAVEDDASASPCKVRLLIEDYPYASDGLAVWNAIEQWVAEYLAIYYPDDGVLSSDAELQAWWKEVVEVGHGDLKDAPWWPKMQTVAELTRTCATVIWIASALHAAVNFGQYPYCGYHPNRPSLSRRPIPDKETDPEAYKALQENPEKFFVRSITKMPQALLGISLLEVLSSQSPMEVYLGQRDTPEWTSDAKAQEAFGRFAERLIRVEKELEAMNENPRLRNRYGPAKFPYTLLFPNTSGQENAGITAKGIPNSITI